MNTITNSLYCHLLGTITDQTNLVHVLLSSNQHETIQFHILSSPRIPLDGNQELLAGKLVHWLEGTKQPFSFWTEPLYCQETELSTDLVVPLLHPLRLLPLFVERQAHRPVMSVWRKRTRPQDPHPSTLLPAGSPTSPSVVEERVMFPSKNQLGPNT